MKKDSYLLRKMTNYMKNKFEKYWGNFDNMNHLLYVGLVLDPQYKLRYLEQDCQYRTGGRTGLATGTVYFGYRSIPVYRFGFTAILYI